MTASDNSDDLVFRLRKRAEIRRQISTRKSVQEGRPDRIADLLEEAADALENVVITNTLNIQDFPTETSLRKSTTTFRPRAFQQHPCSSEFSFGPLPPPTTGGQYAFSLTTTISVREKPVLREYAVGITTQPLVTDDGTSIPVGTEYQIQDLMGQEAGGEPAALVYFAFPAPELVGDFRYETAIIRQQDIVLKAISYFPNKGLENHEKEETSSRP